MLKQSDARKTEFTKAPTISARNQPYVFVDDGLRLDSFLF